MNPRYISSKKINIFLEVLKVNQIINLINPQSYSIPNIDSKIEIHNFFTEDKGKLLKESVYKFITPISKPIIDNCKWTGDNKVLDLYKNSYSGNPIHNLIKCEEKNLAVFTDTDNDFWMQFSEYTTAILMKYGGIYKYSDRICFCKIHQTLNYSWIYLNKKQKYLICKSQNYLYDPLLSYINIKTKEICEQEMNSKSIFEFFLTSEGFTEYQNSSFIQIIENINKRNNRKAIIEANRYDYEEYDEFDSGKEELRYIMENGGDWIRD